MNSISLTILKKHIETKSSQEIINTFEKRPLIHFSEDAEKIIREGFKFGAPLENIDFTFENYDSSGNPIRKKDQKGIVYAFDAISYSQDNNCYDYEYGIEGGMGMYEETAVLFVADAIKTRHPENFEQCLFYGEEADLKNMIILKNEGDAYDEDGEIAYDENGNEYECWSATLNNGEKLVSSKDSLELNDCVAETIKTMIERGLYPKSHIQDFNDIYYRQIDDNNVEEKSKEDYIIDSDFVEPITIPIEDVVISKSGIERSLGHIENKRYSQTEEPIECMYTEEGKIQVIDGYHRYCEALLLNKKNIEIEIYYDERCGYPNQTYANIKYDDLLDVDPSSVYSGMAKIISKKHLDAIYEHLSEHHSIKLETISFDELFHIGTLDKKNKKETTLEGANGLSISEDSNVWKGLNKDTDGDLFKFKKDNNLFVDFHELSNKTRKLINEWGVENGYLTKESKYKHEYFDDDLGYDAVIIFDTLEEAIEEYEREDLVRFNSYSPTEKLSAIVGNNNSWNLDLMVSVYVNKNTDFDGVYWNDELDENKYSAPRGIIFEDKLMEWEKQRLKDGCYLDNLKSFIENKMNSENKIIDQIEEHVLYSQVQRTHREYDDFIDGDLGERIEEYKYYNLLENFDLNLLDRDEWHVDTDLVSEYEDIIEKEGIQNMPKIMIDQNHSIIDGIHRINALLNKGITQVDLFIGSNEKLTLENKKNKKLKVK